MIKKLYYILLQRLYVARERKKASLGKIYMFHKVDDSSDLYAISKENLERFLDHLKEHRKVTDLDGLIFGKDPDQVVLSFDDAYESVYANAYPILKKLDLPYYVFLCEEFLDQEDYLKTKQVEEMLKESRCILGSHNDRHVLCRFLDDETFRKGLLHSKETLEKRFNREIKDFAFPFGSLYACSVANREIAGELFEHVLLTYPLAYKGDPKLLPRININDAAAEKEMS